MDEQKNIVSSGSNSYLDLILLAMTLVFKDVSQVSLKQAEVINLLHTAATELKKNPDLKINAFKGNPDSNLKIGKTATLLDLYAEHAAEYNYNQSFIELASGNAVHESIQEILDNLIDCENKDIIHLFKSNALSCAIENFLRNLLAASGIVIKDIKDLIKNAKMQQAKFVTPDSLYFPSQLRAALKTN